MKIKIRQFFRKGIETLRQAPVEAAISLFYFLYMVLAREEVIEPKDGFVALFPLFFTGAFLLNRWVSKTSIRWIYYVFPGVILPFLWVNLETWVLSLSYFILLVICMLMVLSCRWQRDNRRFVIDALHYFKNALLAALFSGVALLLFLAIYFSLHYIFPSLNLGQEEKVVTYAYMVFLILLIPLTFLTFHRMQSDEYQARPFLDILMNYVLTPALLIYTAILYLYFVTILFSWSLPRGGIAYQVFAFTLLAVLVLAYRPLQQKSVCRWYYDYFPWISLPALIIFWIGVGYRIDQYGWTPARVYLVVCGVLMTWTVLMFLFRAWGRYLYVTLWAVGLLAWFTYVPGMTASDLGIRSQRARLHRIAEQLDLSFGPQGLLNDPPKEVDSVTALAYEHFCDAFDYLWEVDDTVYLRQTYGLTDRIELEAQLLPKGEESRYFYYENEGVSFDISGFRHYHSVSSYSKETNYYFDASNNDTLRLYAPGDVLYLEVPFDEILKTQLAKIHWNDDSTDFSRLKSQAAELMMYDRDSCRVLLDYLYLGYSDHLYIDHLSVQALLTRE